MRGNTSRNTRPELRLRSALHKSGLRFRVCSRVTTRTGWVRPDIVFAHAHVAVFVDGCFWHSCPVHMVQSKTNRSYWVPKLAGIVERDQVVTQDLQTSGWHVLRI